jgi:hypothetical protein
MEVKDQVGTGADNQLDPAERLLELLKVPEERLEVKVNPRAQCRGPRGDGPGRDHVEAKRLVADGDGMACVGSSVEPDRQPSAPRDIGRGLPLSLVAPLETHEDYAWHTILFARRRVAGTRDKRHE